MIIVAIEITPSATVITPLYQCRTQQTPSTVSPDVCVAIGAMVCPLITTLTEGKRHAQLSPHLMLWYGYPFIFIPTNPPRVYRNGLS